MTVFNGERFISQAIESVIAQTIRNWRLIIVDDLSTDSTPDILYKYQRRDSRVLVLKGQHQGIAAAANVGLQVVEAPLLARIDSDDIADPTRLDIQRTFLRERQDLVAVGSYVRLIDSDNRRLGLRKAPLEWASVEQTLKVRNCMCHPSSMIRTAAIQSIQGYRSKFRNSLDYDLWLRLSEVGRIANQPRELLLYRRHDSQISSDGNAHRQTLYSVAAATDYFFRRHGRHDLETVVNEANADSLAISIANLYSLDLSDIETRAVNRHAIRFLRYVRPLSAIARTNLWKSMKDRLNLMERMKMVVYGGAKA